MGIKQISLVVCSETITLRPDGHLWEAHIRGKPYIFASPENAANVIPMIHRTLDKERAKNNTLL